MKGISAASIQVLTICLFIVGQSKQLDQKSSESLTAKSALGDQTSEDTRRQMAFVSDRFGNSGIFIINADGTGLRRLTTNDAEDTSPTLSSDGTKVAFTSKRAGNSEIYVINTDSKGLTRLINSPGDELWPKWSAYDNLITKAKCCWTFWIKDSLHFNCSYRINLPKTEWQYK